MFDALIDALEAEGMNPLPIAMSSLKDAVSREVVQQLCADHGASLVLNTTAFAAGVIDDPAPFELAGDAPVLQVILSGGNRDDWVKDNHGLNSRDVAMHVALPEVDGRIITRAISFKGLAYRCKHTQVDVVRYQPDHERVRFVAELSRRWCRLRSIANAQKRVALILANYPLSEGRIGNGVGLDTPASVVNILSMLRDAGYRVGTVPADGDALMRSLTEGVTNDPVVRDMRPALQSLALDDYLDAFHKLPSAVQQELNARWGPPEQDPTLRRGRFMIAGWRSGDVFIGIQPARSRERGDYASYHDADLVPPHAYLAFYFWLRLRFAADAIVHVGKHGNLEWLPGKSMALSGSCWPDLTLGPMPHLYPFIVNDPGEGSQAKRRAQAVIIDHLMPPLTRAENYGPLQDLERQVDEYYEALMVDPRRAKLLRKTILEGIVAARLDAELGLEAADDDALLTRADAYLCELKEAQIRDGLHTFGASPQGVQRRDTLLALGRFPIGDGQGANASLLTALARDLQLGETFDPLDSDWAAPWTGPRPAALRDVTDAAWRHHGDTRERLELLATKLLESQAQEAHAWPVTSLVLKRLKGDLLGRLDACGPQELEQLKRGLEGRFVPPGPSGSPSRGRPDVLPTGRNFYSVDTRALPTQAAWSIGLKSANLMIERHLQDHGDYPRAVGLSVWGTATMRTGGDDIAQALALMGVRPKWAAGSHRVTDFEILPITIFNRPRIDVTLRVSGFFRDAFANLMHLFDAAVQAIAELDDEPEALNPIRARILRERDEWVARGIDAKEARVRAGWRVFSTKPGAYGAGLQELIDAKAWQDDVDLSSAYQSTGGYAYSQGGDGIDARDTFGARLASIDVVLQNQDNREHDLLDSNDYHQFQGGMVAAVRHLSGAQPRGVQRRPQQPGRAAYPHAQRRDLARDPFARGQPEVDRRREAPRLQGRVRTGGDRRLSVWLRCHRARRVGSSIRARHRCLRERRRYARIHAAAQPARAAFDLRAFDRSDAARLVAEPRRLSGSGRASSARMPNSNSKANELERHCHFPGISLRRAGRSGAVAAGAFARRDRSRIGRRARDRPARHGEIDGGAGDCRVAAGGPARHVAARRERRAVDRHARYRKRVARWRREIFAGADREGASGCALCR